VGVWWRVGNNADSFYDEYSTLPHHILSQSQETSVCTETFCEEILAVGKTAVLYYLLDKKIALLGGKMVGLLV
jgi:hypothetical protein